MTRATRILSTLFVLLSLLAAGCASDRPPSGGPPEVTPLKVTDSTPLPGTTNTSPQKISLSFTHAVSSRDLLYSLSITPDPGSINVTAGGTEAEIIFFEPLRKDCTYILTISKETKASNGRMLGTPWVLAFSTGTRLDTASIRGNIITRTDSPATDAIVMAWRHDDAGGDPVPLTQARPDYLAQADGSGSFAFGNLAQGRYLLVTFSDLNHDMRWDPRREPCGLPSSLSLPVGSEEVLLRIGGIMASQRGIRSCNPLDRQHLELHFGEPQDIARFQPEKIDIRATQTGRRIALTNWYASTRAPFEDTIILETTPMQANDSYRISMGEGDGIGFRASGRPPQKDPLAITILPAEGTNPAILQANRPCLGSSAILECSRPVDQEKLLGSITLLVHNEGAAPRSLPARLQQLDGRTWAVTPEGGFLPRKRYTIRVDLSQLDRNASRKGKKAQVISTFTTGSAEDTGTITGNCRTAAAGSPLIEAREHATGRSWRTAARREEDGSWSYRFGELPPGGYTLTAFIPSRHHEGGICREQWFPGSIAPLQPSDPLGLHKGAVGVRAQWESTGADITIQAPQTGTATILKTTP